MIYFVTTNIELFNNDCYTVINVEQSLEILKTWTSVQLDTETTGTDCHIDTLLLMQLGNFDGSIQIVIDVTTIDVLKYKEVLESKFIIGQNLKFDIQFLYKKGIIIRRLYDTMIAEQVLYLGYPASEITYNLKDIAERYLNVYIDKSIRGQIIWRGIDTEVILYGAKDVTYLYKIMKLQMKKAKEQEVAKAIQLECEFVPVIAYLEFCGIKLSVEKWQAKMQKDIQSLNRALEELNEFVINEPKLKSFTKVDMQGDLFNGFDLKPKVTINWASPAQSTKVFKILGFDTQVKDKKTGEDKDSVLEKHLKNQKGINDNFLKIYFDYKEHLKTTTSFGQGHLDAVNPITGRIHTVYRQLGAASGRMSCGSTNPNTSLAKLKGLAPSKVKYPNIQQLPHDAETRACFVAEKGNKLIDCDWSAAEARLAGDIYNDQAIKDIFLKGIDSHSMYAKIFFADELKDINVNDIKKLRPDLRQLAKGPEFALNFGGGIFAIMQAINCDEDKANEILHNYEEGFKGSAEFAKKGSQFVKSHGYVLMNPITGHKMYWWDWTTWKDIEDGHTKEFWDDYKLHHKGTGDYVNMQVKQHFKAGSKWDRMARNAPTQGTCAIALKHSQTILFWRVVDSGYFNIIKLCALVHDECLWEVPIELADEFAELIETTMLDTMAIYCKSIPVPAEAEISDFWVH